MTIVRTDDPHVGPAGAPVPERPGGAGAALAVRLASPGLAHRDGAVGLMAPGGQAAIDRAVEDGSWTQADEVEAMVVPADLAAALAEAAATGAYEALADSTKRQYLWWVHSARRPATRAARIAETVRRMGTTDASADADH